MRSRTGIVASLLILLAFPAAIIFNVTTGGSPETIVHFMVGVGFVLFALAVFKFALPRWLNVVGAAAAAAFGSIFILQGVSEVLDSEALRGIAFGVLGHEIERILPDAVFLWFIGLLLAATTGRTRIVGWIVMPIVVGLEVATAAGVLLGIDVPTQKLIFFVPFVWLLIESIKGPLAGGRRAPAGQAELVGNPAG